MTTEPISNERMAEVKAGWQDISAAPTDGTLVLTNGTKWAAPKVLKWAPSVGADYELWSWMDDSGRHAWGGITHWMPLPAPPKGGAE